MKDWKRRLEIVTPTNAVIEIDMIELNELILVIVTFTIQYL